MAAVEQVSGSEARANLQAVRRLFAALSTGDLTRADEFVAPTYGDGEGREQGDPSSPLRGVAGFRQSAGRLRSIELTENPFPAFAGQLLRDREEIERRFGQLVNWGGGLTCLPPWVRTHRRVRRWVQAKLVLTAVKRSDHITTCAA